MSNGEIQNSVTNEGSLLRKDRQRTREDGCPLNEGAVQMMELFYGIGNRLVEPVSQDQRKDQWLSKMCLLWSTQ